MFDEIEITKEEVIRILDQYGVPYWVDGKNVSPGWVNIQCPFPDCTDSSNHCGIDPYEAKYNCWICGGGKLVNLLMEITGLDYHACMDILTDKRVMTEEELLAHLQKDQYAEIKSVIDSSPISLPDTFELITYQTEYALLEAYEKRRDISRQTLIDYGCGIIRYGRDSHRIIIPVTMRGRIMAYQAGDLTGGANLNYNTTGKINNYLYNYDRIGKIMIITEGVTDSWRAGLSAVASFGKKLTDQQKYLIDKKELDALYFCWDHETFWREQEMIRFFTESIPIVKVIDLPYGYDPDEIGREYIENWIREN